MKKIQRIFIIIFLSLCFWAEAQITFEPMGKIGLYSSMWRDRLDFEPNMTPNIYWRYGVSIQVPEWRVSVDLSYKGKTTRLSNPFLRLSSNAFTQGSVQSNFKIGDTLYRALSYENWFALSVNILPLKIKKHRLMLGFSPISTRASIGILKGFIVNSWGEPIIKSNSVSQKALLYKMEYVFMPFKHCLISLNVDYARFKLAPKDFYGFTVSVGSYLDYTVFKK